MEWVGYHHLAPVGLRVVERAGRAVESREERLRDLALEASGLLCGPLVVDRRGEQLVVQEVVVGHGQARARDFGHRRVEQVRKCALHVAAVQVDSPQLD